MNIDIPDHYLANMGGALVERAVYVISLTGFVPAYLYQFADMWDKGLRYDGGDVTFWEAVYNTKDEKVRKILKERGVL